MGIRLCRGSGNTFFYTYFALSSFPINETSSMCFQSSLFVSNWYVVKSTIQVGLNSFLTFTISPFSSSFSSSNFKHCYTESPKLLLILTSLQCILRSFSSRLPSDVINWILFELPNCTLIALINGYISWLRIPEDELWMTRN